MRRISSRSPRADLGVQRGQRLVEQQHRRPDRQRPRQRHPLLLAAGELRRDSAPPMPGSPISASISATRAPIAAAVRAPRSSARSRRSAPPSCAGTAHRPGTPCRCCAGSAAGRHVRAVDADRARRSALEARDHAQQSWSCRSPRARGTRRTRPCSTSRLKSSTTWSAVGLLEILRSRGMPCAYPLRAVCFCEPRSTQFDQPHARPGDRKGDHRQRRRLVGAVGAEQLQVGAEGRTVQQASPW